MNVEIGNEARSFISVNICIFGTVHSQDICIGELVCVRGPLPLPIFLSWFQFNPTKITLHRSPNSSNTDIIPGIIRGINERDQLNIRTEDLPEEPEETGYTLDHIHAFIPSRHVFQLSTLDKHRHEWDARVRFLITVFSSFTPIYSIASTELVRKLQ